MTIDYCDCGRWSGSHCRPAHCDRKKSLDPFIMGCAYFTTALACAVIFWLYPTQAIGMTLLGLPVAGFAAFHGLRSYWGSR